MITVEVADEIDKVICIESGGFEFFIDYEDVEPLIDALEHIQWQIKNNGRLWGEKENGTDSNQQ